MCSAAETTFDSGAFATTIPRRVAASTSTLSTPTPGAADHLQPLAALDQVGGQLRRRADDDRVVAADRSRRGRTRRRRRRRSARRRSRCPPRRSARGRGPCTRRHACGRVVRLERRGRRRRRARRRAPSSASAELDAPRARSRCRRRRTQPMWPIRKTFPSSAPWPPRERDAVPLAEQRGRARRRPRRRARGSRSRRPSGPRPARRARAPSPSTPARQARPRRDVARRTPPRGPPRAAARARRRAPATSETAGVNGGVEPSPCAFARARPVEVEARRRVPSARRERRARRPTTIASPGGVISAFCEPDTTTSSPHASVSSGTAPRLEMASTTDERARVARAPRRAPATSATTPVDVSECVSKTAFAPPASASARRRRRRVGVSPHS